MSEVRSERGRTRWALTALFVAFVATGGAALATGSGLLRALSAVEVGLGLVALWAYAGRRP